MLVWHLGRAVARHHQYCMPAISRGEVLYHVNDMIRSSRLSVYTDRQRSQLGVNLKAFLLRKFSAADAML